jgi:hypothetical protein
VFKNKGFLYGLGLGLILGASLLQLMNFAVLGNKTISKDTPTTSPTPSISPSPSASPKVSVAPVHTVKPTETMVNPATPRSPKATTPAVTKTVEPSAPTAAEPSNSKVIIQKGMTSSEVATLLFDRGVVSNRKTFETSLSYLKLTRVIRAGTYTFLPDEKDSEIINKITIHR